jgi:hypothetical protein
MAEYYLIFHGIIVIASWVSFCSHVILEIVDSPMGVGCGHRLHGAVMTKY